MSDLLKLADAMMGPLNAQVQINELLRRRLGELEARTRMLEEATHTLISAVTMLLADATAAARNVDVSRN